MTGDWFTTPVFSSSIPAPVPCPSTHTHSHLTKPRPKLGTDFSHPYSRSCECHPGYLWVEWRVLIALAKLAEALTLPETEVCHYWCFRPQPSRLSLFCFLNLVGQLAYQHPHRAWHCPLQSARVYLSLLTNVVFLLLILSIGPVFSQTLRVRFDYNHLLEYT